MTTTTHGTSASGEQGAAARFLEEIDSAADLPAHVSPAMAAVATFSALLERLGPGEAHDLFAALPADLQPLFEGAHARRRGRPIVMMSRAELVDRVAGELAISPASAELVVGVVLRALGAVMPRPQVERVVHQLPGGLQELWLSPAPPAPELVSTDPELLRHVLRDIEGSGALPTTVTAREAFRTVMCLFGQRLSGGEAKNLLLGLPRTVRPLVERCMLDRREKALLFARDELAAAVSAELGVRLDEADAIVVAVVGAVTRILPREEIDHVASQLPEDLRRIWAE
jgi:uncharacterized protein (DUF2267 family)